MLPEDDSENLKKGSSLILLWEANTSCWGTRVFKPKIKLKFVFKK
jgi:hypothetical protein